MEKNLEHCVSNLMSSPGITAVVCADPQGLVISQAGRVRGSAAGSISLIASIAARLEPDSSREPVVALEGDTTNVLIQKKDGVSIGVYKSVMKSPF